MANIQAKYYIQNLYRLVKKFIYYCRFCQIEKKKPFVQPFADLPSSRTQFASPFEAICIDFFGPMKYKNGKKFYGLIATCLVSRMVKLEVVQSLSANATLVALDHIFLLCGTPKKIYSDNGTNFVRANKEISKFCDFFREFKLTDNRCIEWIFSPPCAPWFNGTAERLIAVVKRCIRVFDSEFRSVEDAKTIFLRIESEINNRPIISNDERSISPFELAYGRPQVPLNMESGENFSAFKWMERLENIRRKFKKLWRHQYLSSLNQNNPPAMDNLKVGDLVLVPTEMKKRHEWPVFRVLSISNNNDGTIRSIRIKDLEKNLELIRPVVGIIKLESRGECEKIQYD
uniref:Uncharacterized protein LOC113793718 n=1 Tax=Dermatophagoides pteronyssinus TaxID=6956 RepID=A0A6P6Y262_DERPT|nr:uncharacterized protein LOC113793718 [Dermatophagoides pteronyssinus]